MRRADGGRLVLLAAIWGASFLFTRIAAPAIGPVATADLRMLIASVALLAYYTTIGFDPQWRRWWVLYLVVGLLNSAAPFLLFSFAALALSAGLLAVLNAMSPMWGALLSTVVLRERLSGRRAAGLLIGVAGVALVCAPEGTARWLEVAAGLTAALSYAVTGVVLKRWANQASAHGMAVGTQLMGGLLVLPFLAVAPPSAFTPGVVGALLALGLVCSALGYILYFRLITDIGPTGALTVTYLIPIFGVIWGALFLDETLTVPMVLGALIVVAGTALVLRG
jgi:drug/metabolite transporter (DMT)-like permease